MAENGSTCNVHADGICGLHNVEVERRKADRDKINETQRNLDKLDPLKRAVWGLVATSSLYLVLFTFTLSNLSGAKDQAETQNRETNQRLNDLIIQVTKVVVMVELREKSIDNLRSNIIDLNRTIEEVKKEKTQK